MCAIQVAAWWAGQKYDDFAVVVQPFYSQANLTLDFLSTVSGACSAFQCCHHGNTCMLTTPIAGLFPPIPGGPPEHGQGTVEQHADPGSQEEDLLQHNRAICVPYQYNTYLHQLAQCSHVHMNTLSWSGHTMRMRLCMHSTVLCFIVLFTRMAITNRAAFRL